MAGSSRRHSAQPGRPDRRGESLLHRMHRFAVPFDHGMRGDAEPLPAPQMHEQAIRQAHRWLALPDLSRAFGLTMKYAAFQIV